MKNNKLWIALIVVVAAIAVFVISNPIGRGPNPNAENVVQVAMNLPITGPFGIYGQTIRDGALLAKGELSTQGHPFKLELDIQDNAGVPATAVTVFEKQILNRVDVYVSGVKPQTMAIFDRVLEKKYPYFVWIFDAFVAESHPAVFRTWVNYKYEPSKYFQYISHRKAKRVAIAAVNMPHTLEEFDKIVIPELSEQGVESFKEVYEWNTTNYRDVILKLSAKKPDLYILNGFQENLVGLVKALRNYRLVGDGNVIGSYDLLDAATVLSKEELEGLRVVAPLFNIARTPQLVEWKERFKANYGREPLYTDAYSYDMIKIIAEAAKELTFPANSEQWVKALMTTKMDGITGPLAFDDGRDLILTLRIGRYEDGTLVQDQSEEK